MDTVVLRRSVFKSVPQKHVVIAHHFSIWNREQSMRNEWTHPSIRPDGSHFAAKNVVGWILGNRGHRTFVQPCTSRQMRNSKIKGFSFFCRGVSHFWHLALEGSYFFQQQNNNTARPILSDRESNICSTRTTKFTHEDAASNITPRICLSRGFWCVQPSAYEYNRLAFLNWYVFAFFYDVTPAAHTLRGTDRHSVSKQSVFDDLLVWCFLKQPRICKVN